MITGFSIILDEDILFCSNELKYSLFETILFIEKLINSINPKHIWRLNSIFFEDNGNTEGIIIEHILTSDNRNLFYCISGNFDITSEETHNMIREFHEKIQSSYSSIELLEQASKSAMLKDMIALTIDYIKLRYNDNISKINSEDIEGDDELCLKNGNKILYCGISNQGLPIISRLYNIEFIDTLKEESNEEKIEVFSSKLSAKLATIAMNTIIRAQTSIKEIHINDLREDLENIVILYDNIYGYSLDLVGSGDVYQISKVLLRLKTQIAKEKILSEDFGGDLKPYKHLNEYLNNLV